MWSHFRVRYQTVVFAKTDIHVRTLRDHQEFSDNNMALNLGISSAVWSLYGDRTIPFVRVGWQDSSTELGKYDCIIAGDVLYVRFCGLISRVYRARWRRSKGKL